MHALLDERPGPAVRQPWFEVGPSKLPPVRPAAIWVGPKLCEGCVRDSCAGVCPHMPATEESPT